MFTLTVPPCKSFFTLVLGEPGFRSIRKSKRVWGLFMVVFKQLHVHYLTAEDIKNLNPLTSKVAKILRKVQFSELYIPLWLRVRVYRKIKTDYL